MEHFLSGGVQEELKERNMNQSQNKKWNDKPLWIINVMIY
jgi:hypothetical protein